MRFRMKLLRADGTRKNIAHPFGRRCASIIITIIVVIIVDARVSRHRRKLVRVIITHHGVHS